MQMNQTVGWKWQLAQQRHSFPPSNCSIGITQSSEKMWLCETSIFFSPGKKTGRLPVRNSCARLCCWDPEPTEAFPPDCPLSEEWCFWFHCLTTKLQSSMVFLTVASTELFNGSVTTGGILNATSFSRMQVLSAECNLQNEDGCWTFK